MTIGEISLDVLLIVIGVLTFFNHPTLVETVFGIWMIVTGVLRLFGK